MGAKKNPEGQKRGTALVDRGSLPRGQPGDYRPEPAFASRKKRGPGKQNGKSVEKNLGAEVILGGAYPPKTADASRPCGITEYDFHCRQQKGGKKS